MPTTLKAPDMENEKMDMVRGEARQDLFREQYNNFISMAAHDMQSPLRKLSVLADRLTQKYAAIQDEEIDQYTKRMQASISDLQKLVDGFTELASAIPGNMDPEDLDLNVIIKQLMLENSARIKEKHAELTIQTLPVITGDKKQIRTFCKEILDNALKFTKEGVPVRIEIHAEVPEPSELSKWNLQGKHYTKISFSDNGIGFDPAYSEKIFDPLVRLNGKSGYEGNGLGLALARQIATNHEGLVYAEQNGERTKLNFIVPANNN